jgi:tetratricopeptide (TPR) repeat protein
MNDSANIALWIIAVCLIIQTVANLTSQFRHRNSMRKFDDLRNENPARNAIKKIIDSGKYEEALKTALERQKTNPGDPYSWYYAGVCYYHMKNWAKAREYFQEAQRMFPTWEKEWPGPYLKAIEKQTTEIKG